MLFTRWDHRSAAAALGAVLLAAIPTLAEAGIERTGFPSRAELDLAAAEDVICKKQPPPVGTRLPGRKVCLAKFQWEATIAENQELMEDTARRGLIRKY